MKRKLAMILAATMVISLVQPAMAAEVPQNPGPEIAVAEDSDYEEAESEEAASEVEIEEASTARASEDENSEDSRAETAADAEDGVEPSDEAAPEANGQDEADEENESEGAEAADEAAASEETDSETGTERAEDSYTGDPSADDEGAARTDEIVSSGDAEDSDAQTANDEKEPEILEDVQESAAKEAAEARYGDFTYENISGGVQITGYSGKPAKGELSIPAKLNGYNVLSIGSSAFSGNKTITKVSFPGTLREIDSYAFRNCTSLKTVTLPASLTSLGEDAFSNTAIASITIPKYLEETAPYHSAFSDCNYLTKVTFASGMKTIPSYVLYGVKTVKTVTIPDSVTGIGESAFTGTSISEFKGHDKITNIGHYAFSNCTSLKTVTLPASLTSLGEDAFSNTAIASITIPKYLEETAPYHSAFSDCNYLTKVTFASGMKTIPSYILYGIKRVETVTIPRTVTTIGEYAFSGCTRLTTIKYLGTKSEWKKIDISTYGNDALFDAKLILMISNRITAKEYIYRSYSTKAQTFRLGATATGGKLTYKSSKTAVKVSSDGKVTISPKFTGTAKITITAGGGNYMTVTKDMKITVPGRTNLAGVTSTAAGKMTIKWNKNAYVNGYVIQYSQKKDFTDAKTFFVFSNSTVSRTVTGLGKNKKYYVRIRSFRTEKTDNRKNYYYFSAWSASKEVTIKK